MLFTPLLEIGWFHKTTLPVHSTTWTHHVKRHDVILIHIPSIISTLTILPLHCTTQKQTRLCQGTSECM